MAITGNIDLGAWLGKMYGQYTTGRAEEKAMFGKGVGALEQYADIFRPGGEYGAGIEAMIGRGEKKAVASGYQNLVSAGLANTTMPMHLQQTYQEEIGMPTRLRAEDVRMERLGGALGSLGQMYAGYDAGGPTGGDIAHMATGGFSTMMQSRIADMNAQQAAFDRTARNQAGLYSQNLFRDQPGGGGGGGGGTTPTTTQHRGGFANPYGGGGGGFGGGGFAEGELPVMVGGQRVEPGTEDIWKPKISRQAAAEYGIDPLSRGYTYDPSSGTYIAPGGGGETVEDDPFFDYASNLVGISQYI
ncbi:hypothetical protein LCGC14_1568940 [marine sediment metagenome]|uniref:Uncharacterized protein n=1 Tax=marine sediment metagenome TaxID=412755 RepID=A0A0F9L1E4_9ZZZZ